MHAHLTCCRVHMRKSNAHALGDGAVKRSNMALPGAGGYSRVLAVRERCLCQGGGGDDDDGSDGGSGSDDDDDDDAGDGGANQTGVSHADATDAQLTLLASSASA